MGVTASQPNDAELSWEAGLYRYDVRSARAKSPAAGQDAYVISVSEIEHKSTETSSVPSTSDTCESAEERIKIPRENQVGVGISYRNGKRSLKQPLLERSDLTVWEVLRERFEWVLECQRSGLLNHDDSDYDTESEDADDTTPTVYECAVLHRPKGRPSCYLKAVDWHRAMGEVSDYTLHAIDTDKLTW